MEVFLQVFLIDILSGSQICILSSMYMFSSPRKKPSHVSNALFFHKPLNFLNCHFNNQTKLLNSFFKERCFSHGQSAIERGFSINKQLFVENLQEKSLVSQQIVHGNINSNKIKVQEYDISSDFLKSCRLANSTYITTIEKVRKQKDECYFIVCIGVSSPPSKAPLPSFYARSPLKYTNCPRLPFQAIPFSISVFRELPTKSQIFQ